MSGAMRLAALVTILLSIVHHALGFSPAARPLSLRPLLRARAAAAARPLHPILPTASTASGISMSAYGGAAAGMRKAVAVSAGAKGPDLNKPIPATQTA